MIDLKKALKNFKEYLNNYDLNDPKIKLKAVHTYGVMDLSEYIARDLNLDEENLKLAQLIALLHDIARFEQLKQFGMYEDYITFDHGDLAVKILFEDGLIRNFIEDSRYDNIILKAIKNHNKLNIEVGLNDLELLHAKIIRDADKTDNFRVSAVDSFDAILNSTREKLEHDVITEKIYNDFMSSKVIINHERKTDMDNWVSSIAFIFDYNFSSGLKYLKEKDYINIIVNRIDYKVEDTKEKMETIRKHALQYINNKIKE